jgi:hypothetical protein
MNESSVAPGQTAGFQFYVKVPTSGIFYEPINLVAEGQAWFNNPGLTLYLQGGSFAWQPVWSAYSSGGNANMSPGASFTVTVKALNTGTLPWTNSSTATDPWPVTFGTDNPMNRGSILYDPSWLSDTRPTGLTESTVEPGQEGTFVFKATIPANAPPGPRNENFNLVAEGLEWFVDPNFSIYVNIL